MKFPEFNFQFSCSLPEWLAGWVFVLVMPIWLIAVAVVGIVWALAKLLWLVIVPILEKFEN